ncbi:MAG: gas vesicle protein GvpG [Chloroflexi bacterium]|nr:gas vesicle protein GvpG [Chloroflexota bacterium]
MGLLFHLLTSPILGPIRGVHWLAQKAREEAERQYLDMDGIGGELLKLQARHNLGEINNEDYDEQETALVERLNAILEARAQRG